MINRAMGTAISTAAAALLVMAVAPRLAVAQGPSMGVTMIVGETEEAAPGDFVFFDVTLNTGGNEVAGTQNDIWFDPETPIAADENGRPSCLVNPDIDKNATTFAFQPAGCEDEGIGLCTGIRALVLALDNVDAIPPGSVLYTCEVAISPNAPLGSPFPLQCSNAQASDPEGNALSVDCFDGAVDVPAVLTPPTATPPTTPPTATPPTTPPTATPPTATPPPPPPATPPPSLGDNDSCQVVAPADSQIGWLLLVPVAALFWMRRRSRLH